MRLQATEYHIHHQEKEVQKGEKQAHKVNTIKECRAHNNNTNSDRVKKSTKNIMTKAAKTLQRIFICEILQVKQEAENVNFLKSVLVTLLQGFLWLVWLQLRRPSSHL